MLFTLERGAKIINEFRWMGILQKIEREFSTLAINKTSWSLFVLMWYAFLPIYTIYYVYTYIYLVYVFGYEIVRCQGLSFPCGIFLYRHDCETCINECKRHMCLLQVDLAEFVFDLCRKMILFTWKHTTRLQVFTLHCKSPDMRIGAGEQIGAWLWRLLGITKHVLWFVW